VTALRVAYDLTPLHGLAAFGVARVLKGFVRAAAGTGAVVPLLVHDEGAPPGGDLPGERVPVRRRAPLPLWREAALPRLLGRLDACVLHEPVAAVPLRGRVPAVATIHEVPGREAVPWEGRLALFRLRLRTALAAHRAAALVAVSPAVAAALLAVHPSARARLRVVAPPVEPGFRPARPEAIAGARRALGLPNTRYLLQVGAVRRKKDPVASVRALGELSRRGFADVVLVLVGPLGDAVEDLHGAAEREGLGGRVVLTGEVSDALLGPLYSGAEAVLCPSHAEGLGLVPMEALACGAPVVARRAAAAPSGAEARCRIAEDPRAMADALEEVLREKGSGTFSAAEKVPDPFSAAGDPTGRPGAVGIHRGPGPLLMSGSKSAGEALLECYRTMVRHGTDLPRAE